MQTDYWQRAWNEGRIGFHQARTNRWLSTHWPGLGVAPGATVFVPLCGKSLDMLWLHRNGYRVLGVELSEKAVAAFFTDNELAFERRETALGIEYRSCDDAPGIRLIAGDYFALEPADLAQVSAVYDRASLVAMNDALRERYAQQLARLLPPAARGLLVVMDYDRSRMQGPPFAVSDAMVQALLGEAFDLDELERLEGADRLGNLADRGLQSLVEHVYRIERHPS